MKDLQKRADALRDLMAYRSLLDEQKEHVNRIINSVVFGRSDDEEILISFLIAFFLKYSS